MNQYWQRISLKIDALSLRERAIIFAMAALILVVFINTLLLEPQYARQKQFSQRVKQEQSLIAGLQAEIKQKALSMELDPDAVAKARLKHAKTQAAQLQTALLDMQNGLVSPDKMSALLEDILKKNRSLRLVSLKTMPASSLLDSLSDTKQGASGKPADAAPASTATKPSTGTRSAASIYRHGVEIVLQGSYLDTMAYLKQLEEMPWQLFWSRATLSVDENSKSNLTLTLFTLSPEEKWLNL